MNAKSVSTIAEYLRIEVSNIARVTKGKKQRYFEPFNGPKRNQKSENKTYNGQFGKLRRKGLSEGTSDHKFRLERLVVSILATKQPQD